MYAKKIAALATASMLVLAGCSSTTTDEDASQGSTTSSSTPKAGGAGGEVGVFTWWADGSEARGLQALETVSYTHLTLPTNREV